MTPPSPHADSHAIVPEALSLQVLAGRVAVVSDNVNECRKEITKLHADHRVFREEVRGWIAGNPSEPKKPSVMLRLDRLERAQRRAAWFVTTALGAAITIGVGALWNLLSGRAAGAHASYNQSEPAIDPSTHDDPPTPEVPPQE